MGLGLNQHEIGRRAIVRAGGATVLASLAGRLGTAEAAGGPAGLFARSGGGDAATTSTPVPTSVPQPFTVAIPDDTLSDLQRRLAATRWPDEIDGAGWDYGTNSAYLRDLVDYWRDDFDWRAQEQRLNSFSHARAMVDGTGLHFIHARGTGPAPIPVLILHGWPGSFVQMLDLLPLLTDPGAHGGDPADAFDVVIGSLPGFGFSDRPTAPGMSVGAMAPLFHKLMTETLGYGRYAIRAGDLGAGVMSQMAADHPEAVIGIHAGGTNPYIAQVPDDLSLAEQEYVANAQAWNQAETAYALLQGTKPQTLAHALNDSPTGLASWIVEKVRRWSDSDGDIERRFSKDEILTNLMVYWTTQTIGSSMRLYYEVVRDPRFAPVDVPTAYLMSPKDFFPTPREWVARTSRIDRWTEIDRGGHVHYQAGPEIVAGDLRGSSARYQRSRDGDGQGNQGGLRVDLLPEPGGVAGVARRQPRRLARYHDGL